MLPNELIAKIRQIEIKSDKLVQEVFSGEYHSLFRGNGIELEDIREYSPGDDIRSIDWNASARGDKAYIKVFREERELNVYLLIDMSASTFFGAKQERITELAATLAFSVIKNNDKIGCLFFTDKVEKFIPSKKGKKHALSIIASLLETQATSRGTDILNVLSHFARVEKKRSIVFLISDFYAEDYEKQLAILALRHDLILIRVREAAEKILPRGVLLSLEDAERGTQITVDNLRGSKLLDWPLKFKNLIDIETEDDFVKPLMLFFKRRMRR
ncbi:MAG: DUF58 domain-containing protein [Spirochaetae bacterium HGW-Spirochaetae-6]|nr:MAG: DUF58 domain-containing protein [Spirochaetae bacterium HGW-Spirochaetae-6]